MFLYRQTVPTFQKPNADCTGNAPNLLCVRLFPVGGKETGVNRKPLVYNREKRDRTPQVALSRTATSLASP
jgi:hypothetical protein